MTSLDSGALILDSMASGHEDEGPKRQRVFWALSVGMVCAVILVTSGENGLNALQEVIIVIGAPVMALVLFQSWLLLQALREDAGTARPLRTRQWKQVLPLEEYHRRAHEDEHDLDEFVIRPEYEVGTEPEYEILQPNTYHRQQRLEGRGLLTIGLTGGVASGKSVVAEHLAGLGAVVIDADELSRAAVAPGSEALREIREVFGQDVITDRGELDRHALAEIVFGNAAARESLNEIVHARVRQDILDLTRQAGPEAVVVVDLPLLVETRSAGEFDLVLTVETPAEARVLRLVHEREMSSQEAWARVDAQATDAERREVADEVIVNDSSLNDLSEATQRFWDDRVQPVLDRQRATAEAGGGTDD